MIRSNIRRNLLISDEARLHERVSPPDHAFLLYKRGRIFLVSKHGFQASHYPAVITDDAVNDALNDAVNIQIRDRLVDELKWIRKHGGVTIKCGKIIITKRGTFIIID